MISFLFLKLHCVTFFIQDLNDFVAPRERGFGPGGGGGTLIFSYIRRLGSFSGGSKFWISIMFFYKIDFCLKIRYVPFFVVFVFFYQPIACSVFPGKIWHFSLQFFFKYEKLIIWKTNFLRFLKFINFLKSTVRSCYFCQNKWVLSYFLAYQKIVTFWTYAGESGTTLKGIYTYTGY